MNSKIFIISFLILLSPIISHAQVTFIANFENGSIGEVKLIENNKYHITTKADPNNPASPTLPPSNRWFYFLMTGVKGEEITLDITGNDSKRAVYSYDGINFIRFTANEIPQENKSITKRYENDSVYIAYFTPYTGSYLNNRIATWAKRDCVDTISIGKSEYGRDMPLLIITNKKNDSTKGKAKDKKIVYIHGRVHPSETPGSWHLDKMIDLLISDSEYANNLRDNAIFYILPFTNPDGVYNGLSRSNGNGINLEVNWADNDNITSKEVKNIRAFLQQLTSKKKNIDLFMNMHSQTDPNITYWIHTAESTSSKYYKELMLLANLTINDNPYFKREDISFSKVNSRYLEGWFWDNFGEKTLAATFETPYTYYNKDRMGEWVTVDNLKSTAINNIYAIGDYLGLGKTERVITDNPKSGKKVKVKRDMDHIYFGSSYLLAKEADASVKFKKKELKQGEYNIYMWNVGESKWNKIDEYTQKQDGAFKYIYKNKTAGEKIDAILFIRR